MSPVDKTLQTQIDDNLRKIFEEDAQAELPETLLSLLDRLDQVAVPPAPGADDDSDGSVDGRGDQS